MASSVSLCHTEVLSFISVTVSLDCSLNTDVCGISATIMSTDRIMVLCGLALSGALLSSAFAMYSFCCCCLALFLRSYSGQVDGGTNVLLFR